MNATKEITLVLLKPDAVLRRQIGVSILKKIMELDGASVTSFKETKVSRELAKKHYAEHETKDFFPWLIEMITHPAGVIVLVIEGVNIVEKIRSLLGPTFVGEAKEKAGSLRGSFGLARGVNVAHASDKPESGKRESKLWMDALGLKPDRASAEKLLKEHVKKWDGRFPDHSRKCQEICEEIRQKVTELSSLIREETDMNPDAVKKLIKTVVDAFVL
ncbi:MAG: nucleoside-diphosphate kinase [Promethearchaeota archaeon]